MRKRSQNGQKRAKMAKNISELFLVKIKNFVKSDAISVKFNWKAQLDYRPQ